MDLNKQMTTQQTIIFLVVITVTFFIAQQEVYGQNSSSRVDQLIQDTERQSAMEESYRIELVKRMENTTCLPQTIISKGQEYPYNPYSFTTSELELRLEDCVKRGIIK